MKCFLFKYFSVSQECEVEVNGNVVPPEISSTADQLQSCETNICETSSEGELVGQEPARPKSGVLKKLNTVMRKMFTLKS